MAARLDQLCTWLNGLDYWSSRALVLGVLSTMLVAWSLVFG